MPLSVLCVQNQSTTVDASSLASMCAAVSAQLRRHAAPAWGRLPVPVVPWPANAALPAHGVPLVIFDQSDQAGALGYHAETPDGQQYGRVFAQPVLDAGGGLLAGPVSVSSVLSHEALEWWADPSASFWSARADGTLSAIEIADACEDQAYPIRVAGGISVFVSDFLLPAYFDPQAPHGAEVDYVNKLSGPFSLSPGGYVINMAGGAISQVFGDRYSEWRKETKGHPASRTARRLTGARP